MATNKVAFSFYKRVMESRKIKSVLKVTLIVCVILVAAYFILNAVIQRKISQQLTDLSPSLVIRFSKVHANIFSSSVSFDSLGVNFIPYNDRQENRHCLYFSTVSVNGISFLKFLFSKKLEATDILLDNGNIQLDSFLLVKRDSAQSKTLSEIKWPFKKFYARNIELKNTEIFLHSENSDQRLVKADAGFKGVSISSPGEKPSFDDIAFQLSDLNYQSPEYRVKATKLAVNSSD